MTVSKGDPIKIFMLGFRGFPNVQGGVEVHVENLSQALIRRGCEVHAIVRSGYVAKELGNNWHGVQYHRIWSPKQSGVEAFVHSFLGVIYAGIKRPDILHIHGIGPGIFVPLARLLGLKVLLTHHSLNYEHDKWGFLPRWLLLRGESLSAKYANEIIVVSAVFKKILLDKYNRNSIVINNGVNVRPVLSSCEGLEKFNVERNKFILTVGRLVPEKRQLDLIRAFLQGDFDDDIKLVIIGSSDYKDSYYEQLIDLIGDSKNIVMTGYLSGVVLQQMYSSAALFVLPSSNEGQPIALLEALSYGLPVIASNIPATKEMSYGEIQYFEVGDTLNLTKLLEKQLEQRIDTKKRNQTIDFIRKNYDWDVVSEKTLEVYKDVLSR